MEEIASGSRECAFGVEAAFLYNKGAPNTEADGTGRMLFLPSKQVTGGLWPQEVFRRVWVTFADRVFGMSHGIRVHLYRAFFNAW